MDDNKGKDVASQETKEYWEKEKARLEASKLSLEFQNYQERLRLEDEKLKSDLKDWYFRALTAVITLIASAASFFIGRIYETSTDENKQRFELQLERDRVENEEFSKNVAMLSSADASQRAGAVATLRWYVQHSQQLSESPSEDKATRDRAEQRIEQVLRVVSVRLPSETDPLLLQEYSLLLVLVPSRTLPYIVGLNREAGPQFARSAAQYVASNLRNPSRFQPEGCYNDPHNPQNAANQQEVSEKVEELADLTTRTQMPFEGDIDESGRSVRTRFSAPPLLRGRLASLYQLECRRIVDLSSQEKKDQRMNQRTLSSNELLRATRILSFSSLTLNRVLHRLSGQVANQNLDGTFMLNGSLDDLNLSNAKLTESYIAASGAQNFVCEHCDFSYADLSQFYLMPPFNVKASTFKGAIVTGALKDYVSTGK